MDQHIINEANRLKQEAGQELENQLKQKFSELVNEGVIASFEVNRNFAHKGYEYEKQYLANFILKTLDDKYIVINSSNSYRQDRVKIQSYDLDGVKNNSPLSKDIVASILLYPDNEIDINTTFKTFRDKFKEEFLYSPATHVFVLSELLEFLENHKTEVEILKLAEIEEQELQKVIIKDGSYFGIKGNSFERQVVSEINNPELIEQLISSGTTESELFNIIILSLCKDKKISPNNVIDISATNSILKLKSGGNAKTDVSIVLRTRSEIFIETISLKTTTQNQVSCHDYKVEDFIRVLNVSGTKLANYLKLFQKWGSHEKFIANLPSDSSSEEFESLLSPHKVILVEWALKGKHDSLNLIDIKTQVSNYLLINKLGNYRFVNYDNYIQELFSKQKASYGIPLSWTYPSKQLGKRIQFKLPIIFDSKD